MRTFEIILTLTAHSFREQWKNRFFQLILIFGGVIIYAELILGAMAQEQEARVLTDFGLALIEMVGLAAVILGCATTLLKEIETKTIYLILYRPVPRNAYIAGKLAGLLLSVGAAIACMGAIHAGLLLVKGLVIPGFYGQALLLIWLKIIIIGALSMFISLFTTSALSSVVIASIFWTLGHFLHEVGFLLERTKTFAGYFIKPLLYLVPNMQIFNLRDRWDLSSPLVPGWPSIVAYTILYAGACVLVSMRLFRKKEF